MADRSRKRVSPAAAARRTFSSAGKRLHSPSDRPTSFPVSVTAIDHIPAFSPSSTSTTVSPIFTHASTG